MVVQHWAIEPLSSVCIFRADFYDHQAQFFFACLPTSQSELQSQKMAHANVRALIHCLKFLSRKVCHSET